MQDNHEHRAPFPPNCMLATQWLASVSKPSAMLLKQHNHTRSIGALDCWSLMNPPHCMACACCAVTLTNNNNPIFHC